MRLEDLLDAELHIENLYGQTVRYEPSGAEKYKHSQSRTKVLQFLRKNCDKDAVYYECSASDEWFKARLDAVANSSDENRQNMMEVFKRELNSSSHVRISAA